MLLALGLCALHACMRTYMCRCGANHSFMPIVVEAISPREFLKKSLADWTS